MGYISGTVSLSDSASAEGTLVFVSGTSLMTVADSDGKYTIANVPATPHGASYRVVAMLALYGKRIRESLAVASGSQATADFALARLDLNTGFGKIITVTDGGWMPVTVINFEDVYGYIGAPNTSSGFGHYFHDISEPAITTDVIDRGAVLVYLQPNLSPGFGLYWEILPSFFEFIDISLSIRVVDSFTVRVGVGKIRLYHSRLTVSGAFVSKSSCTLPDRDFKYTVITAGTLSAMSAAGVDTSNASQMMRLLSLSK